MKAIMKPTGFLVPFTLLATSLFGQNQKLSREFDNVVPSGYVNVIVQYDHIPSDADRQKVITRGGIHRVTVGSIKGDSFNVPASSIADVANDSTVTHISIDHKLGARNDYAAAAINATVAWTTYSATGKGVGIAIIDSGISGQNDVSSKVVYSQDFTGGNGTDAYGHGTHVADTAAGNRSWMGTCSTCTRNLDGMAPEANLINLRVLDASGEANDSTVISAIETAIQLKSKYNIRVINLSLGRPPFESYTVDPLCQAVEAAWKAGIVVVVAAGNDGRVNAANNMGYGTVNSPANDPYVLTVGAMKTLQTYSRTDDLIASYSSKGPSLIDNIAKPDLVAPGNYVVSALTSPTATLPTNYPVRPYCRIITTLLPAMQRCPHITTH